MSKTVIDVWVPDLTFPGWMDRWYGFGAAFNARHPDLEVVISGKDFWTFPAEVARAAADGKAPALSELYFYVGRAALDMKAQDGSPLFRSVSQAVGGRTEIHGEPVVLDDLVPAFREYYTNHGDLTSMPSVGTTSLLYANLDILEKAGVSALPETWHDVETVCDQVASMPAGPGHAITWSNHGTFYQQALASQGGLLTDQHNGRLGRATTVDLASKEMLTWAQWWQQLHSDGLYLHTGGIPQWAETLGAFAHQKVAIRISSSNDVNYMVQAAKDSGFRLGVGIFPYNDAVPYAGNAIAGTSIWLTNDLPDAVQDGALAFLQFLHNPANAAQRHKDNSFAPITESSFALLEQEGWFDEHPHHRVTSDHVAHYPHAAIRPTGAPERPLSEGAVFGDFAGNQNVMATAMRDVLTDGVDPAARFTQATEEAQGLLDAYNAFATDDAFRTPAEAPNSSLNVEYFTTLMAGRDYSAADMENVVRLNRAD